MAQIAHHVHDKLKSTSSGALLFLLKVLSGGIFGLTLALIGDEILGYQSIGITLITVSSIFAFLRISKNWQFVGVMIFNLICVLVGMLLRMYILVAPGS